MGDPTTTEFAPLDPSKVGTVGPEVERSWGPDDGLLYAVAVGAGAVDPSRELAYTTENSAGVAQRVLPTYGVLLGNPGREISRAAGEFDPKALVHAGQTITLHQPIPPRGSIRTRGTLVAVDDKGSGALLTTTAESVDAATGAPLFTTSSSLFIRGAGGFGDRPRGGGGSSRAEPSAPREPDLVLTEATTPGQALLYRLCGDRNPLHSDPSFATAAGFDRPILHGLCTYGITGRALLAALCDGDDARFRSFEGRFVRPVLPGQTLEIAVRFTESDGGAADRGDEVTAQVEVRTEAGVVLTGTCVTV